MREYLLDTSVASILDPQRQMMTAEFAAWLTVREPRLYLSTITIFEVTQGIGRLRHSSKYERAQGLEDWLAGITAEFGNRILPVDLDIAGEAGVLSAEAYAIGRHPGAADILIAATAKSRDLLLLTRNARHFEPLGIDVVDPLVALPA